MTRSPEGARGAGPILVLDPSTVTALAAVRGLGRAGWRVIVAGSEPWSRAAAAQSRYVERYYRIPASDGPSAAFGRALGRLTDRARPLAIVAGSDPTAVRLHEVGSPIPTVPIAGPGFDRVTDKLELVTICRAAGVHYPETWVPGEGDDPPDGEPLVVKPRRSAVARSDRVATQSGASVVRGRDAVADAVRRVRAHGLEPIVQRRVERAFKICASIVRHARSSPVRITYDVLREFPVAGGMAAAIETIDPHRGIGRHAIAVAEQVCDAAGYAGIANVEMYGDHRGNLYVLEVNARPWGSIWLAEHLGLEVTARAVEGAIGLPPRPAADYPVGRRFHRTTLELRWLLSRSPERGPRSGLLRTVGIRDVYDVLSLSDPRPMAGMAAALASAHLPSVAARLRPSRRRFPGAAHDVVAATAADADALLDVWEASVRATHDFLSEVDIDRLRPIVRDALRTVPRLACVRDANGAPRGFVGAGDGTIHMLFVDPASRGRGIGRALLAYATDAFGARALDVNEENVAALDFYRRLGWEVVGRSPLDHTGMPHPILHMRLPGKTR